MTQAATDLRFAGPAGRNLLGAREAARAIAAGRITSEALVRDCLARIGARETVLHAWAWLDPDRAVAAARARDRTAPEGPLHGVPVGIKDIFDTADMPTEYGLAAYRGHRPAADSACVAALRRAGAVILGKTLTTEFASPYPSIARNPHDPARSPGVSSSGSAAAVADYQVPLAIGSQTGGSTIMPAAHCGIVGYKASLDGLDRTGWRFVKPTLDTLGLFARSVGDIVLMREAMRGRPAVPTVEAAPRIGLCRTPAWDRMEPDAIAALEAAAETLAKGGARLSEVSVPAEVTALDHARAVVSGYEGARGLRQAVGDDVAALNPWSRANFARGMAWSEDDYREAQGAAAAARTAFGRLFAELDALLAPSAPGEAPADLGAVQASGYNPIWTLLHAPAVTLPAATGGSGLPVGVQLVGPVDGDDRLLALAGWAARTLETERSTT